MRVPAADGAPAGVGAVANLRPAVGSIETVTLDRLASGTPLDDDAPFVVAAAGVDLGGEAAVVLVAASLEDAAELTEAAVPALALGLPAVLAAVGLITWILTGRALAPIDRMRREAEQISASALDRRLPVPATRDEVRRLAATLNAMLERLHRSAAEQRRFVADASHELRSPLAVLRAMVDTASDSDPFVADITAEVGRMEALVADLLYLARAGELPASDRIEIDLDQTVGKVVAEIRRTSPHRFDAAAVVPVRLTGDPSAIERLVRNLVDNAARHASSAVQVEVAEAPGEAVLRVADDGPGIPPEERERVFERFVRLDEGRARDAGGAGLGLAVVRAAAAAHGGSARVLPSGSGTVLEVRLAR